MFWQVVRLPNKNARRDDKWYNQEYYDFDKALKST
jgi:hypothetical protein